MKFFEFRIGAWQVNKNKVQTILFDSPVGGMRQPVTLQVNIAKLRADFESVERQFSASEPETRPRIHEVGQQLASVIFPRQIASMLVKSLERISAHDGIRIRLCLDEPLIDMPWEYSVVPEIEARSGFLILNPRISIVREAPLISGENSPTLQKQRLVFAGTLTRDGSDKFDVKTEFGKLSAALKNVGDLIRVDFTLSADDNIQKALVEATDIFHYSGHTDETDGRGYLIKVINDSGESDILCSDNLAFMLRKSGTKLALFSACNSGRWFFTRPLIEAGIPIIIGAYSTITTKASIVFSEKLYQTLAVGLSLDEAVTWARICLADDESSGTWMYEWGSFMVYMPTRETVIFPRPATAEIISLQNSAVESRSRSFARADSGEEAGRATKPQAKTVLILAANPKNTDPLRLEQEIRDIENGLERSRKREDFILRQKHAVRQQDVRRAMLDYNPSIVHFCGHGAGDEGIAFEDENGMAVLVGADALSGFFELFADKVECVVLNACYSEIQADAIAEHIPYVIGMKKEIGDMAAIEFAVAFYDALGAGQTIDFAYRLACNAIQMKGLSEQLTPVLKTQVREIIVR